MRSGEVSNFDPWNSTAYRGGCAISLAGLKYCLHKSLDHSTPDSRAFLFKCVLEHFWGVSNSAKHMAFLTNIIITVNKACYIRGGAIIVVDDYDAGNQLWGSRTYAMWFKASSQMQHLVHQSDVCLALFMCKEWAVHITIRKPFQFFTYIDKNQILEKKIFPSSNILIGLSLLMRSSKGPNCICLRYPTNDGLDHSLYFNVAN